VIKINIPTNTHTNTQTDRTDYITLLSAQCNYLVLYRLQVAVAV